MEFTVHELAALIGGQFAAEADGGKLIRGAAAVADAGEGQVTFFGNAKYLPQLKASRATAALVPLDFAEPIPAIAIRVGNPSLAFASLLEKFAPPPVRFAPGVHPTAVIGRDVFLGENVSVQPFSVIEDGAQVGANTIIGAHGYVGHEARIGAGCQFSPPGDRGPPTARSATGWLSIAGRSWGATALALSFRAENMSKSRKPGLSRSMTTWKSGPT